MINQTLILNNVYSNLFRYLILFFEKTIEVNDFFQRIEVNTDNLICH